VPNLAYVTTNQTFTASNTFSGVLIATNATNVIYGSFTGNGIGLTNLNISASQITGQISPAQLPASVVTNGASGLSLSGTFTGNGAGISNVAGVLAPQIVAGTNVAAQANTAYVATNAAQVSFSLPATANVGDVVQVNSLGAGGWSIVPN
jgi:hypothetical protein